VVFVNSSECTRKGYIQTDNAEPRRGPSGIGRAIAVELARWDVPIILVARDVSKLWRLAEDLQICYGIKCCVLGADLSEIDASHILLRTVNSNIIKNPHSLCTGGRNYSE
jgi:shikimate 5-dehydrogenase